MLRRIILCLGVAFAGPATAQECPHFFRFVDFGLQISDGGFSRGGPILRAESFSGTSLLSNKDTICRSVRDIASDGHGNPIPVVTTMAYDVEKAGLDLLDLRVSFVEDSTEAAERNAQTHWKTVDRAKTKPVKGQNSLCVLSADSSSLSCQLVSPYPGNIALTVYCDGSSCKMPVLAMNDHMSASASWAIDDAFWDTPDQVGEEVFDKVQSIFAFLEPLSSGV
ncbi:MAG: hypothetical protein ABJ251_12320 [Paracoccaceae bacterium]